MSVLSPKICTNEEYSYDLDQYSPYHIARYFTSVINV